MAYILALTPVIEPAESEPEPDSGSSRLIKIGAAAGAVIGCLAGPVVVQGRLEAGDRGEHAMACLVFAGVGAAIGAGVEAVKAGRRARCRQPAGTSSRRGRRRRGDREHPASPPDQGETQVAYTIRRSARRKKTVAVTVDPTGGVLLVAPEHFATSRLDAVVRRKAAWIVQRLRRVQSHDPPLSPREFVSGESVLYLGRHYRLKVHPNATGDAKLRGGWLHVSVPAGALQRTCALPADEAGSQGQGSVPRSRVRTFVGEASSFAARPVAPWRPGAQRRAAGGLHRKITFHEHPSTPPRHIAWSDRRSDRDRRRHHHRPRPGRRRAPCAADVAEGRRRRKVLEMLRETVKVAIDARDDGAAAAVADGLQRLGMWIEAEPPGGKGMGA